LLFSALLDIFFPPLCLACKSFVPDSAEILLCAACREKIIPIQSPMCVICGIPFHTEQGMDHTCGECATTHRPFAAARSAVIFDGPAQELIHRLKYGKKTHLSHLLALLTARRVALFITESGAELVVPVPLHRKRLRQRGFNQSVLLSVVLAKSWHLPISKNNLRRIRWTEPQIHLAVADRMRNVRGAFAVKDPTQIEGKRLVLVDDVYTTGSTVTECARVLRNAGAKEVYVVTIARAVLA
jgi:ComF family protein